MGRRFCLYCCSDLIWICVSRAGRGFGKKMRSLFNLLKAFEAAIIFLVEILTSDTEYRRRTGVGNTRPLTGNVKHIEIEAAIST